MAENTSTVHKRILIVLDNLESDWAQAVTTPEDEGAAFHLLTIGFTPQQAFMKYGDAAAALRNRIRIVDTKDISSRAEEEARACYLNLIRDLPRKILPSGPSLSETLFYQERNLWWFLDICEKNIWTDRLIHRLYALYRFIYIIRAGKYSEVRLFIKDHVLLRAIADAAEKQSITRTSDQHPPDPDGRPKGFIRFTRAYAWCVCREFIKLCLKMAVLWTAGSKTDRDALPHSVGVFSIYPLWWSNAFSKDAREIIFSSAPETIAENGKLLWLLWLIPGRALFGNRKGWASYLKDRRVIVLEKLLGVSDVFCLFDPKLFLKFLKANRITNELNFETEGVEISGFVREEMSRSLVSPMFFQALQIDRAFRRLTLQNLKCLLFRLEFQPLERAILYNATTKTKTIGFQHSALGKNFLNYVFTPGELSPGTNLGNDETRMPLPDLIVSSGEIGLRFMRSAGYPADRTAVSGAVRYGPILDYLKELPEKQVLRKRHGLPLDKKIILVATSPLLEETLSLLSDLMGAVESDAQACHVIVRCHPNVSHREDFVRPLQEMAGTFQGKASAEVLIGAIPLYDSIALSDALVLSGGSVALEAMLLGCIPIIYTSDAQFSHNPMTEYPDAVLLASDRESLKNALAMIHRPDELERMKASWEKPIRDMFYDLQENPNKRFRHILKDVFRVL